MRRTARTATTRHHTLVPEGTPHDASAEPPRPHTQRPKPEAGQRVRLLDRDRAWFGESTGDTVPTVARVEDYLLGRYSNFTVDRELGDALTAVWPALPAHIRARRALHCWMTARLIRDGVRQFLDVGCGMVGFDAIHEIAAAHTSEPVTVLYIDTDPTVVAYNDARTRHNSRLRSIRGDLGDPDTFLPCASCTDRTGSNCSVGIAGVIDPAAPVAVLLSGVLEYLPPIVDVTRVLSRILGRVSPGSYLGVTQLLPGPDLTPLLTQVTALYARSPTGLHPHNSHDTIGLWQDLHTLHPLMSLDADPDPDPGPCGTPSAAPAGSCPRRVTAHTGQPNIFPDLHTTLVRVEPADSSTGPRHAANASAGRAARSAQR
ncbi:SAM-dependent methyltransferase [Dactylosporangium sp. NPDC051485]|uniref:SAM-dependent methyltransferase n=1 Tax=Dactylosporangium sp. NPDC051485 TaxID=3154846 RepID=UPI003438DD2F